MTVINNIIELIGTDVKSIADLVRETDKILDQRTRSLRLKYVKKLSDIEGQLLDEETREFMERQEIPPELGYLLAYQHHIKRMTHSAIHEFIYEKTGQKVCVFCLFKNLGIPSRNHSEGSSLQHHPNINFQLLEQRLPLSYRDLEVLETRIQEGTNLATAVKLSISEQTVKNHLSKMYEKLDVYCFTEAVTEAYRRGLLQDLTTNQ